MAGSSRVVENVRRWRKNNPEKYKDQCRRHRENNRQKIRQNAQRYRDQNREAVREYHRQYRKINPRKRDDATRAYYRDLYRISIDHMIKLKMRARIHRVLKSKRKSADTVSLVGITISGLIKHLENQFHEGMNWNNYGNKGWHIDHIIPCDSFDLSDPEQQRRCFHYTNLQPLWWWENLSKSNKLAA